jgi:hypothetical protein
MTTINRAEAEKLDAKGCKYVDFDEVSNCYGIFGSESSFCYESYMDEHDATSAIRKVEEDYDS